MQQHDIKLGLWRLLTQSNPLARDFAADGSSEYSGGWRNEQRHGYGVLYQVRQLGCTALGTCARDVQYSQCWHGMHAVHMLARAVSVRYHSRVLRTTPTL